MRLTWFLLALVTCTILAGVNYVAVQNYWFWTYRWLDTPMHLLGGFALASLLVAFLFHFRPYHFLAGMVIVAVGWEVFEYALGLPQPVNYVLDTAHDLLNDTVGASVAYLLARYTIWRSV